MRTGAPWVAAQPPAPLSSQPAPRTSPPGLAHPAASLSLGDPRRGRDGPAGSRDSNEASQPGARGRPAQALAWVAPLHRGFEVVVGFLCFKT